MRAALWALLGFALALACASLDQPERSGERLDDGVAPYQRAETVELCFGPARVVDAAPTSGEAGVCRTDSAGASCVSHDDCSAREACICGRCTVQLCRFNRDCRPGLVCGGASPRRCAKRCDTEVDCPSGESCEDFVCVAPCSAPSDCASGELCLSGRCRVLACGPSGPSCGAGASCDLQLREGTLHAPTALALGSLTVLYLELREAGQAVVLRAESTDGARFTAVPDTPVLAAGAAPFALPDAAGAGVELYFTAGDTRIARARSADGKTFDPPSDVLVAAETWEAGRVASPGLIRIGATLLLFYEGGAEAGIGLARSDDGNAPFTRASSEPLLAPSDVGNPRWTALEAIGGPSPIAASDPAGNAFLRLFLHARGREDTAPKTADGGAAPVNDSIALAVSPLASAPSPLEIHPHNPVLGGIENLAPIPEREPAVLRIGDEWRLYYESGGKLHLATNPPR